MLTSITPLGERGRGNRFGVTATAYVVGSLLGGATTGIVLGTLGHLASLPRVVALALGALACAAAALLDLRQLRGHQVPSGSRQVDEDWLTRYRGWVYGLTFGYQLGLGVVTIVTSAATYALLCLAVLSGSPAAGLVLGTGFGAVRAAPLLALRRVHDPQQLRAAARRLSSGAPAAARGTVVVLTTCAGLLGLAAAT